MPTQREKCFYFNHGSDWTIDPKTGRYNSSEKYIEAVADTNEIIRKGGCDLLNGNSEDIARRIVTNLALRHGLAPIKETKKRKKPTCGK